MKPIQQPITGKEAPVSMSSPHQALAHFYKAFNDRNLSLMESNWANTDEVAMDNPLGGIERGWAQIRLVYERIFGGPAEVYVEFYDYTILERADLFCAVGRERGYFRLGGEEIALAIRTSRIFEKIGQEWRQVHHHGSIEDPVLLDNYQAAVLGRPLLLANKGL